MADKIITKTLLVGGKQLDIVDDEARADIAELKKSDIVNMILEAVNSDGKVTINFSSEDGSKTNSVDIPFLVDDVLSTISANPVQNKVVYKKLLLMEEEIDDVRQNGIGGLEVEKKGDKVTLTILSGDGSTTNSVDIPLQTVDNSLNITSMNPVQNRVITQEIDILQKDIATLKENNIGGQTGSILRLISLNENSSLIISHGSAAILMFTFTSEQDGVPSGNGTLKIFVDGIQKASNINVKQGANSIDVSPYLAIGANNIVITCTDVFGNSRSLAYDITIIKLEIQSTFDATVPYYSDITFKYTPYGAIDKEIHFVVDGVEGDTVQTGLSGKQMTRTIKNLTHGTHKLEVYSTATMYENTLTSPKLTYDIIYLEDGRADAMIASAFTVETVSQGEMISIPYIVYDPAKLACDISLTVYTMESGERVIHSTQNITVDRSLKYWNTRKYPIGTVYFEIKYGDIVHPKTFAVVVEESKIKIEAETTDLELLLSSEGRSNDESNPGTWSYGDVTTTFTNMNWGSVGWIADDNGDTCLRLNGDARAEINFQPFKEDIRTYGKTIELEFAVRDVNNRDATVISCMSGGLGFEVKADTAYIISEQSRVFCNYKDEERVRLAFVIESKSEYRLLYIYLNGVLSDVIQYPATDNFQQLNPVNISVGSSDCGVDLYVVRSYTTALPSQSVVNNYIADMVDIVRKTEIHEENDVYDGFGAISFAKAKEKNSVMVLVGPLPQSKGDKKTGKVVYYDVEDSKLDFEDTMQIDVQGTSSQFYVRKNWKIKTNSEHSIDFDQLPGKVLCIKVDYAEATGTHNTQNAVFVERLYSEKIPPQEVDPKVRTTIYGKPILLFHQENAGETPVFYGKANFNFDKGAENVFGFTSSYDVECWEFCNNTSDACNFLGEIPESWGDDFEARYPDKYENIDRFKQMHDWVVSTKGNVTKFKNEFENYFNLHYSLIYYVYTFVALMVDQRAKNMFLTYWGKTGKWYPYFYDNDTCFGINNEGQLVFDYYHEDNDQVDGANVYNGQNSTLWVNFREAYADEIQETYQKLRGDGLITYDILEEQFITKGSNKWSESVYNEDSEFKYISMVKSDDDASNLPFARGDGEEHFKYFVKNRLNYCDSKWYATDYANDFVSLRIYTPTDADGNPRTDLAVAANADITIVPYSNMYAGVRYKANGTLYQERVEHGEEITFEAPNETFNDTETAIYGASQLSSLKDLAPLYCGTVNLSKATKLTEIKIGDGTPGYANNNLKELSVGTNKLLKKIDIQNCPSFTSALGLAGCQNIEEIYAKGSGITGVELADSGYLKIIQLPATIANLTIKNQEYIEEFSMEGYSALKTMRVENCPAIDTLSILDNATNLERVRLTGVEWEYDDTSFLYELKARNLAGIDENGANIDKMWLDGTCHIKKLTGAQFAELKTIFPYLEITYDELESYLIFMDKRGQYILTNDSDTPIIDENGVLVFNTDPTLDEDGALALNGATVVEELTWVEVYRESIINGGNGTCPVAAGLLETPVKASTPQFIFTFNGWSKTQGFAADETALLNVEGDRHVYAAFTEELRYYTVNFYIDGTLKETYQIPYNGTATFAGSTVHPTDPDIYEFVEWRPSPANITGDTNCYAQYYDAREIQDSWATIAANVNKGTATSKYAIGSYKPVEITYEDGTSETINMEVIAHNHDELTDGVNKWEDCGSTEQFGIYMPFVVYNNEMHLINGTAHKKWNGSAWVDVATVPVDCEGAAAIVYNNELHIMGAKDNNTAHYKFNGTEWSQVGTLPYSTNKASVVMYNNEIHLLGGTTQDHYKYNGTSWTQVSTLPKSLSGENGKAFVYNNEIHISGYKYNGTQWIETDTNIPGFCVDYNGEIYAFGRTTLYKFTGEDIEEVCDLPYSVGYGQALVYNGEMHVTGGSTYYERCKHWKWSTASWELVKTNANNTTNGASLNYGFKFEYKNELYAILGKTISKLNGDTWENILTNITTENVCSTGVVDGDYAYVLASNCMYKYDIKNNVFEKHSDVPYSGGNARLVLFNNRFHILAGFYQSKATCHKVFDTSTNTWIDGITPPWYTSSFSFAFVLNNELHYVVSRRHFILNSDETEWREIGQTPDCMSTFDAYKVHKDKLYCIYPNGKYYHVYDGENWTMNTMYVGRYNTEPFIFRDKLCVLNDMQIWALTNPKATLTFFAKNALKDSRAMHSKQPCDHGWAGSDTRTFLNNSLYTGLPEGLQVCIKDVKKIYDDTLRIATNVTRNISSTNDKIWLLSMDEVGTDDKDHFDGQGECYPVFTDNISRKRQTIDGTKVNYNLRSLRGPVQAYYISADGWAGYGMVNANQYVVFGFCI